MGAVGVDIETQWMADARLIIVALELPYVLGGACRTVLHGQDVQFGRCHKLL
jgi:hypothetical protein